MPIASWAHARDPVTNAAVKRVDSLPLSKTGHGVSVPFPYASRTAYKEDFSNKEINQQIEQAPLKRVSLHGLHAIQHSVIPDRVKEYVKHPNVIPEEQRSPVHRGLIDVPIVVQYQGMKYIHDGHHRLTGDFVRKQTAAEVRFVDLDGLTRE